MELVGYIMVKLIRDCYFGEVMHKKRLARCKEMSHVTGCVKTDLDQCHVH